MRTVTTVLIAALTSALGLAITYFGLVRLGWMRHCASPWDLSFLHLEWALQPALPYWCPHVENLGMLVVGVLLAAGPGLAVWFIRRRRMYSPDQRTSPPYSVSIHVM